jgi:hypothetical protein
MAKSKPLTEEELKALVNSEMRSSLGYTSSKLSHSREKAIYYYLGLPVGDLSAPEVDGRSSVISTDVRDTIEAILPQLMVTFTGSDKVAEFEAQKPEDEEKARLATEYMNYLFFKKNAGHKLSLTWMKDALMQKNGIVKVWWDTRHEEKKEEYRALTDVELAQVMDDEEVEVTEQTAYPDENDVKQREQAIAQLNAQMATVMQAMQQGDPKAQQAHMQIEQQIAQINDTPPVMLYDITCKRIKTEGKISIENVPPEEFLIDRQAKNIQDAKFVGHRVQRTVSELKSMGYKNVDDISGEDQSQANNAERIQRLSYNDENAYMSDEINTADESQRNIWVTECYLRTDFDGDGISELRKVTIAGDRLLDNEEVDFIPFVSICPTPLPHTFFGLSIADLAMEKQKSKTSLLRAMHDNVYLEANGRYFALEGQVNLDDLMTSRPGGIVRIKSPGAVGRLDQGATNSAGTMALMEFTTQQLENSTGWSRQSMGNDASGLATTATAANIVTNKADMRIDLIARNFAEGFSELFLFMLKLTCQHQNKKVIAKIAGDWKDIDPREWRNQFDVNINVGIGLGNKDQKIQQAMMLMAQQEKVFPLGVSNAQGIYQASTEVARLLGYKNADKFFTDPSKQPPQPPRPDPEQIKMQGAMQLEQMKMQAEAQGKQFQAQATAQVEQMKLQFQAQANDATRNHEAQLTQLKMQMQAEVDNNAQLAQQKQRTVEQQNEAQLNQMKFDAEQAKTVVEYEHKLREQDFARFKAQLEAETRILVAQIGAEKGESAIAGGAEEMGEPNMNNALALAMQGFTQAISNMNQPRTIVRGPDGRAQGIM